MAAETDPQLDLLAGFGRKLASGLLNVALTDLPQMPAALKAAKGKGGEVGRLFLRRLACEDDRVAGLVAMAAQNPALKAKMEQLGLLPKEAAADDAKPAEPV